MYVKNLAYDFTINITPIYNGYENNLQVSEVEDGEFTVYGKNCKFFWTVFGKREEIEVEANKTDKQLNGQGPYTWLS